MLPTSTRVADSRERAARFGFPSVCGSSLLSPSLLLLLLLLLHNMLSAARRAVRLPKRSAAVRAYATEHNPPTRFESSSVFPDEPSQPSVKTDQIPGEHDRVKTCCSISDELTCYFWIAGPKSREHSAAISQFQDPRAHVVVGGARCHAPRLCAGGHCVDAPPCSPPTRLHQVERYANRPQRPVTIVSFPPCLSPLFFLATKTSVPTRHRACLLQATISSM